MIDSLPLWLAVALAFYGGAAYFTSPIERAYFQEFAVAMPARKLVVLSHGVTLLTLAILAYTAREELDFYCFPALAVAGASLRSILAIDRKTCIIPDRLQALGGTAGIVFIALNALSTGDVVTAGSDLAVGLAVVAFLWILSLVYFRLRGVIGFGLGDVKLLGWLAFFVGSRVATIVFGAACVGIVAVMVNTAYRSARARALHLPSGTDTLPFGPAIVFATAIEEILYYA
jgi:leader peptidase (prepilin peptidase) / N-methyltransferase